jgi:hypothetical protein
VAFCVAFDSAFDSTVYYTILCNPLLLYAQGNSPNSEFPLSPRNSANLHSGLEESSSEHPLPMEVTLVDHIPAPPQTETAGPLDQTNHDSLEHILTSHRSRLQDDASHETFEQNGEQALESHEVTHPYKK